MSMHKVLCVVVTFKQAAKLKESDSSSPDGMSEGS